MELIAPLHPFPTENHYQPVCWLKSFCGSSWLLSTSLGIFPIRAKEQGGVKNPFVQSGDLLLRTYFPPCTRGRNASSLQPAQLTESPVAESIQEGRMAICQRWEQDSCTGGRRSRPLHSGAWISVCDSKLLGFCFLSVLSKLQRSCESTVLALGLLGLSTFKSCVLRF